MLSDKAVAQEKTLFDVVRDIWQAKFYLFIFAVIALIAAFIFISISPKYYRANMIIAPAVNMGQGMSSAVNIGEGSIQTQPEELQSSAAFLRFETIYDGVSVASLLLKNKNIMSELPKNDWSVENLSEYLRENVKLEPVSGTYLRKIIYFHTDKEFAEYMVAQIHSSSDKIIRKGVLREVEGRILYLNKALSVTTNQVHRRNLTSILLDQERLKMMVSLDQPYAAAIIEPPSVSSKPRWPDPYAIYPVFLLVGLLLGFVAYGLRHHG